MTGAAASSVVSVWVVPEDLDEAIVEQRLTAAVRRARLGAACKRHQSGFWVSIIADLEQQQLSTVKQAVIIIIIIIKNVLI